MEQVRQLYQSLFECAIRSNECIATRMEVETTIKALARRCERSCFNSTIDYCSEHGIYKSITNVKFCATYSSACYRILCNLRPVEPSKSSYLVKALIDGIIDPLTIADLPSYQLAPEATQEIRDEIALRRKQKLDSKVSRAYTCKKCGDNRTVYVEYQSRAADEAASISIRCVNCEHIWRR